jgi:hypothetical protein
MAYRWNPRQTLIGHKIPQVMGQILAMTEQVTKKLDRAGPLWQEIERQVKLRDNWSCQKCGTCKGIAVYHIVPIEKGGSNLPFNLRTYCKKCYTEMMKSIIHDKNYSFKERGL